MGGGSRELAAIEVTATDLEPGQACTTIVEQPHPNVVLLSHFEVTELSPSSSLVELTDLRIDRLSYLVAPVPLLLLAREQQHARARAEQEALRRMPSVVLALLGPRRVAQLIKPSRRGARSIVLDVAWRPKQQLSVIFRNSGTAPTSVTIELVLYSLDEPLPTPTYS